MTSPSPTALVDTLGLGAFWDEAKQEVSAIVSSQIASGGFLTGISRSDVTGALGYTPPQQDTTYPAMSSADLVSGNSSVPMVVSPSVLTGYVSDTVDSVLEVIANASY